MMKKKALTILVALGMATLASAQTANGGISADMLKKIEKTQTAGVADKALFNAIASNSIDDLSKNFANQGAIDTYFSNETKSQSIHNQKSSGRCWKYAIPML